MERVEGGRATSEVGKLVFGDKQLSKSMITLPAQSVKKSSQLKDLFWSSRLSTYALGLLDRPMMAEYEGSARSFTSPNGRQVLKWSIEYYSASWPEEGTYFVLRAKGSKNIIATTKRLDESSDGLKHV